MLEERECCRRAALETLRFWDVEVVVVVAVVVVEDGAGGGFLADEDDGVEECAANMVTVVVPSFSRANLVWSF